MWLLIQVVPQTSVMKYVQMSHLTLTLSSTVYGGYKQVIDLSTYVTLDWLIKLCILVIEDAVFCDCLIYCGFPYSDGVLKQPVNVQAEQSEY